MRYAAGETPVAVGVLPAAGTVTVQVLEQLSNTLLNVTTSAAVRTQISADADGRTAWQWPLTNIQDPIDGFAQLIICFEHQESGERDYCKMLVRGIYDDIQRTRRLVSALL